MPLKTNRLSAASAKSLAILIALALAICFPLTLAAQTEPFTLSTGTMPAEVERMYVRGMQFLAKTQDASGSWSSDQMHGSEPAVIGLAVVSMLAHGDDPNSGPYSTAIKRGLDYIIKHADSTTGFIGSTMYNHGFATLALAEAYGAVDDPRLGPTLKKAVDLILRSQEHNQNKAWRYNPDSTDADTTVSGCQMVALLAARNAGLAVPETAIDKGLEYFKKCQTSDGGIGYTTADSGGASRTAIACTVYCLAKDKNSAVRKAAFGFLKNSKPDTQYGQYYIYYASQAHFHDSTDAWQAWNSENIKTLRQTQSEDGHWDESIGRTFGTAASLLSLALNYRYLPIYER